MSIQRKERAAVPAAKHDLKRLRIFLLVFFIAAAAIFGVYKGRELMTADNEAPVIKAPNDAFEASVSATDADLMDGMTATDNKDGDVTSSMVVVSKSKFISDKTLKVTYAAFDSHNNVGTLTRKVTYTDYHSPRISITSPMRFLSGDTDNNYLANVTANDCLDGDISGQVTLEYTDGSTYDSNESKVPIRISVTNSEGDTGRVAIQVRLCSNEEFNKPCAALSDYVVYTDLNQKPDYASLEQGIWQNGNVTAFDDTSAYKASSVVFDDSEVDYTKSGCYQCFVTLKDEDGESEGTVNLAVWVGADNQGE